MPTTFGMLPAGAAWWWATIAGGSHAILYRPALERGCSCQNGENCSALWHTGRTRLRDSGVPGPVKGRRVLDSVPLHQKSIFNPNCITRALPEPIRLLPAAMSGVPPAAPNEPGFEGSIPLSQPFEAP